MRAFFMTTLGYNIFMKLIIHTDGGSLSNPGQAAWAYHIDTPEGVRVAQDNKSMGIASNNVAEYTALVEALKKTVALKKDPKYDTIEFLEFYLDSELVVKQVNGIYKVKHADMRDLYMKVKMLEVDVGVPISYIHVLREKNAEADALVKKALGR